MIASRRPRRSGFTLLEVLLASAIAVMLLGALYVAFDLTLRQTEAGRDSVARGDLARAVVNRMTIDMTGCIGPMPPKSGGGIPEDTSTGTTTTTTTTTDPAAALDPTEGTASADVSFQSGMVGTDKQVTLFVSRVPPALGNPETANPASDGLIDTRPDLRRVSYYLGSNGGLCRQEKPWVTADGVRNSTDPDRGDEASDVIAEEVTDVSFQYFDGTGWVGAWTGTDTASDGGSVLGPPRAIMVTLTFHPAGGQEKIISHVIPIRAAVGIYKAPAATTDDAATTTTGM